MGSTTVRYVHMYICTEKVLLEDDEAILNNKVCSQGWTLSPRGEDFPQGWRSLFALLLLWRVKFVHPFGERSSPLGARLKTGLWQRLFRFIFKQSQNICWGGRQFSRTIEQCWKINYHYELIAFTGQRLANAFIVNGEEISGWRFAIYRFSEKSLSSRFCKVVVQAELQTYDSQFITTRCLKRTVLKKP
jgi:hypothetical protein